MPIDSASKYTDAGGKNSMTISREPKKFHPERGFRERSHFVDYCATRGKFHTQNSKYRQQITPWPRPQAFDTFHAVKKINRKGRHGDAEDAKLVKKYKQPFSRQRVCCFSSAWRTSRILCDHGGLQTVNR